MFLLPTLLLPLAFGLAVFRLYQIPCQLWSGALRLPGRHCPLLWAATVGAYLVLLCYTVALSVALIWALFFVEDRLSAYLSLLFYIAAYPLVYFGAAWVFYYGLQCDRRCPASL